MSPASVNGRAVLAIAPAGPSPPAARARSRPRGGRERTVNVRFAESTSEARSWWSVDAGQWMVTELAFS